MLPSRKSDQGISISDFYQTIFLPKIRQKADTNLQFWRSKSDLFKKPNSDVKRSKFYLKKSPYFRENVSNLFLLLRKLEQVKSDFLVFSGQKADFSGKKRTNLEAFFWRGPLSDQGLIKRTYLAALQNIGWIRMQERLLRPFSDTYSASVNISESGRSS